MSNEVDLSIYKKSYQTRNIIIRTLWYFISAIIFKSSFFPFSCLKKKILFLFGSKIGSRFYIKPNVNIKYPWHLKIGENVSIGEGVWIDNLADVNIGSNVCISQNAYLLTGSHNYKCKKFSLITKKIEILDGAWIGAKSIVCPGVICGNHSVLTVASVATKNLDEYGIYQGNPAKLIRVRKIDG